MVRPAAAEPLPEMLMTVPAVTVAPPAGLSMLGTGGAGMGVSVGSGVGVGVKVGKGTNVGVRVARGWE